MLRVVCQCISGFSCWHDLPCLGSVRTKAAFVRAMWVPLIHTETNSAPTESACARTAAAVVGVEVLFVQTEATFVRLEVSLVRASWLFAFLGHTTAAPSPPPPLLLACFWGVQLSSLAPPGPSSCHFWGIQLSSLVPLGSCSLGTCSSLIIF